jgi:transposase
LQHGLLQASFIPPVAQRDRRELTRQRTQLVRDRTRVVNRIHKVLESCNIKLGSVATDLTGVSSRRILEALVQEQRDPAQLANLAIGRLRDKLPELEAALAGRVRAHHRFILAQHLAHLDFWDEQIERYSAELERLTHPFEDLVALLDTIPGVARTTAELILAEVGPDMSRFPSAAHLAAWAGLAPGNHQSGGKRLSGQTRKGNQWLRTGLVQAANAAARQKNTYLAAQYHRLAARRGRQRALIAVAPSILVIAYHMLEQHEPYHELGANYFDERKRSNLANRLARRLERLGYTVSLTESAPA